MAEKLKIPSGMLKAFAKPKLKEVRNAQESETPAPSPERVKEIAATSQSEQGETTITVAGTGVDESRSFAKAESSETPEPVQQASEATTNPADNSGQALVVTSKDPKVDPAGFRTLLDQFQKQMEGEVDAITLGFARSCVKRIMIELKENPEYDGILTDTDVRGIFMFLRQTVTYAAAQGTQKVEKKVKREAKKASIVIDIPDISALGNLNTDNMNELLGIGKK